MDTMRVRAEIDLDAVLYNMNSIYHSISKETEVVAVIKTDAYGHGASEIAEALEKLPYLWGYAVATADEAASLIRDGRRKPILILGVSFPDQYEGIVADGIRPTVCGYASAKGFSDAAVACGKICRVHIKVDTGMSRIGFQADDSSVEEICRIAQLPNIEIEGIFTHFARADEISKEPVHEQMALFLNMIKQVEQRGISIPLHHCSNSAGIVEIPDVNLDLVRAGIILYGLWPSEEVRRDRISLRPVMSLKSHISFLKELGPGRSISYGGTYVTTEFRRIATVPVGYGDGYSRGLSNKGYVLIRGQRAPICGRICMDQFMVDVTDIPDVKALDEVTLLGRDGQECITMEELGGLSGRFNYEFACLITPRVPRIYVHKGL